MKIPSCFFGTKPEVKKECAKVARKVWKGVPLLEAVAGYELIDTKENRSALVVYNPVGSSAQEQHFYLTFLVDTIQSLYYNKIYPEDDEEKIDRILTHLIEYDWSILGLCEQQSAIWYQGRRHDRRHRFQPYLRKMYEFWDIFKREGRRYIGLGGGKHTTLWEANNALQNILYKMGVPDKKIDVYKASDDLRGLCDKYNLLTLDVLNDPEIYKRWKS